MDENSRISVFIYPDGFSWVVRVTCVCGTTKTDYCSTKWGAKIAAKRMIAAFRAEEAGTSKGSIYYTVPVKKQEL